MGSPRSGFSSTIWEVRFQAKCAHFAVLQLSIFWRLIAVPTTLLLSLLCPAKLAAAQLAVIPLPAFVYPLNGSIFLQVSCLEPDYSQLPRSSDLLSTSKKIQQLHIIALQHLRSTRSKKPIRFSRTLPAYFVSSMYNSSGIFLTHYRFAAIGLPSRDEGKNLVIYNRRH